MSSALQSNLSSVGYDLVVATTQKAINSTMLHYLQNTDKIKPTAKYYVWRKKVDAKGKKIPYLIDISLEDLLKTTASIDPFEISPDADPDSDVNLQRLRFGSFACAFSITPGLPEGIELQDMPNIIELGHQSSSVKYNMLCSDVKVCALTYTGMDVSWQIYTQSPKDPWAFSCKVDLRMSTSEGTAFSNLDKKVQQAIREGFQGEDAFSVQQLLLDLDNAGMESVPTMQILGDQHSLDPNITNIINGQFLDLYFADMHARGQPTFHVAAVSKKKDESEFRATDLDLVVAQLLDNRSGRPLEHPSRAEEELSTLNYVCMSNHHRMPPLTQMQWNWMTEAESQQYDGVISYWRDSFATMLVDQLQSQVQQNCYYAKVKCELDRGSIPQYAVGLKRLDGGQIINPWKRKDWDVEFASMPEIKVVPYMSKAPNPVVLEWFYQQNPSAYDQAGTDGVLGKIELKPSYNCRVEFRGNKIIVTQHLLMWLRIVKSSDPNSGNIIDRTIVETITLKVDNGRLSPTVEQVISDKSENPGSNAFLNFWNRVNDEIGAIRNAVSSATTNFNPAPISIVQKFQFPGGKTFAFRDFQFSNNQDLTAGITYADPA